MTQPLLSAILAYHLVSWGHFQFVGTGRPDHCLTSRFDNGIRFFQEFLLNNHFLGAYYLGFDWSGWRDLIKMEILIALGMVWPVSSDKRTSTLSLLQSSSWSRRRKGGFAWLCLPSEVTTAQTSVLRDLSEISRGGEGWKQREGHNFLRGRGHEKWAVKRGRVMQIIMCPWSPRGSPTEEKNKFFIL